MSLVADSASVVPVQAASTEVVPAAVRIARRDRRRLRVMFALIAIIAVADIALYLF
jgi:hypothetical protein